MRLVTNNAYSDDGRNRGLRVQTPKALRSSSAFTGIERVIRGCGVGMETRDARRLAALDRIKPPRASPSSAKTVRPPRGRMDVEGEWAGSGHAHLAAFATAAGQEDVSQPDAS